MDSASDLTHLILAALAHGAFAVVFAWISLPTRTDLMGWRRIEPGLQHWVWLALSGVFLGLLVSIAFLGLGRTNPADQSIWALFVTFAALGPFFFVWQIRRIVRSDVRWRGSKISYTDPRVGYAVERDLRDAVEMKRALSGHDVVRFKNGELMKLDPHANGIRELRREIEACGQAEGGGQPGERA